jgi:hypothetical protein
MRKKDIFARLRSDMDQVPVSYQWEKVAGAAVPRKEQKAARPQRSPVYRKAWQMAAAAAMLLVVVAAVMVYQRKPPLPPDPLIPTQSGQTQTRVNATENRWIPAWDEKTIAEKFPSVAWNSTDYNTSSNEAIPAGKIGSLLGEYTTTGYDYRKGKQGTAPSYQADCEIYAIRSIANACAVAVKFAGTDDYFPYINAYYRPNTLGDFINDLNLRENLRFGSIDYFHFEGDEYVMMQYSLPDPSVIWTMLLADTGLKNVADTGVSPGAALMTCGIDVNVIGLRNIALSVTENGYLTTNILSTEKSFFIGKDAANRFVAYVLEHGSGRRMENDMTNAMPVLE